MPEPSKYTYFLLRLPIAISMFGHGVVRMPKLEKFSNWMIGNMEKSFIPESLILPFSYVIPIAELLIGLFLILGLWTRQTLSAGMVLMSMLIFGSSSFENWDPISSQLIHAGYMGALLLLIHYDRFSLDVMMRRNH